MTDTPPLDDDAIREMLERRASLSRPSDLLASVRAAAEATPQRRLRPAWSSLPRQEVLAGLAGLAAVLAIALTIGISAGLRLSGGQTSSATPSIGTPSSSPSVSPAAVEPVLPLTVDQLNALMAANTQSLLGRELVITGNLVAVDEFGRACAPAFPCSEQRDVNLERATPALRVLPSTDPLVSPWVDGKSVAGTFAATLTDASTLTYQGPVMTGAAGATLRPSQLPSPAGAAGLWLVHGWIVSPAIDPACGIQLPPTAGPASGPQYGCGRETLLSDDGSQPGAPTVRVQNDAYQAFGPWPSTQEQGAPHEATFLLDAVKILPVCGPTEDCAVLVAELRLGHHGAPGPVDPARSDDTTPNRTGRRGSTGAAAQCRPAERASRHDPSLVAGRMLVINGTVERNPSHASCPYTGRTAPSSGACAPVILAGSVPTLGVQAGPNVGGGPWIAGGSDLTGTFAAKLVAANTLEYLGPVTTTADGQPLLPSQLAGPSPGFFLVHGWIAGETEVKPCPYVPGSESVSGPQYGCGRTGILSDQQFQPVQRDPLGTTFAMPPDGIQVQNDAYQDFAPGPQVIGPQSVPEQATFVVQGFAVPPACELSGQCIGPAPVINQWAITARLDPWLTAPEASARPAVCSVSDFSAAFLPWGATSGPIYSELRIVLKGSTPCLLSESPEITIRDGIGRIVAATTPTGGGGVVLTRQLDAGLSLSAWCSAAPTNPLSATVDFGNGVLVTAPIDGFVGAWGTCPPVLSLDGPLLSPP